MKSRRESKARLLRWVLVVALAWEGMAMAQTGNLAKIDPELQELMYQSRDANETFRVIIEMAEQYNNTNLERGTAMMTRAQRRDYVVNELKHFSEQSQTEVVNYLTEQSTRGGVTVLHRFWIFNGVCCEATAECISVLSTRHDVRFVTLDKEMQMIEPIEEEGGNRDNPPEGVQWHVSKIRANEVWTYNDTTGYTGNGVVVAIIDSGVNYNHQDISGNMWNKSTDPDYNPLYPNHGWDFFDNDCDPFDEDTEDGHGSHVAGIVASHGPVYQAGIAPGATIMALKVGGWVDGEFVIGDASVYCQAVEFAIENGADVLNLSLGSHKGDGGEGYVRTKFINALNAGVVATVSAGNNGCLLCEGYHRAPYNIGSPGNCPPPWLNPAQSSVLSGGTSAVICVGNVKDNDERYYSSSFGPVTWAEGAYIGNYHDYPYERGSNTNIGLIRPDVVAPGASIWSIRKSVNDGYHTLSGTSMAAPCVAGVIALMLEANPNLTPAIIDEILETTAEPCEGQTMKNNEYGSGRVDAYRAVAAALAPCSITAVSMPSMGGTIEGAGSFMRGEQCLLTATPNMGYEFVGWIEVFSGLPSVVSYNPEYTFTVNGDRSLIASFQPVNYTINVTCSPSMGGVVSGNQGSYLAGSTVTFTATANTGYAFSGWMENGVIVSSNPTYTFQIMGNRNLSAIFRDAQYAIGNLVTNPDGSQGVVFHLNQAGTEGWMVALDDASEGCAWGEATNVLALQELSFSDFNALSDLSGFRNTGILRTLQGENSGYAADQVDYNNGWYLPSSGQLRKLYAALPFIEESITAAGGNTLTGDAYWSSSEYSATNAHVPSFAMSNANKTSTCRVRAIHNFVTAGSNMVVAVSSNSSMGTASVSGNGSFTYGAPVTVTAMPNAGYAFDYWSEDGVAVSYDATYQFTFNYSRYLTAHFVVAGSVGSIICNADGSKGVSFWLSPDGTEGLMVALEDASEGCVWGPTEKVYSLVSCPFNDLMALKDNSGARNTRGIRNYQGMENEYAATLVDFANGWYLPSAGELRKLYAALPMIEEPLAIAGGQTLTEDNYWSSTEYSATDALVPSFSMNNTNKGGTCRVRAIRSFATAGPNCVTAKPNNVSFGTTSVSGSGEFAAGQSVIVTAYPEAGYVFDSWTEAGMTVSYSPTYEFNFTRSRALTANFVAPGSIGSTIVNADGSKGVVFYTDPSGVSGWQVALTDDSDGCPWGNSGEDVLVMDNLNPDPVYGLLSELDGTRNSRIMRGWFVGESGYAANQVNYEHQWFLPTAGQLRKLYAAMPMIETAIINAGGTLLTDDAYWSSTEQSADNAWTPSFAFGVSNKGENHRVRAIRHFYTANIQNPHIFVGTNGILWSDPSNWINPSRNLLNNNDDVIVTTQCLVDEDATVKSLTMTYGSTINVDEAKTLAVTESISNTYDTRINLGNGSQLVNPTEGTYFSMNKTITGYGESEDGGWYTVATPLKSGMSVTHWTTGSYDLYYYDEPTYYWINQKDGNNNFTLLENGHGYLYSNAANQTMNFTGQAKSSISEYSMSFINTLASSPINGFNLLGNPFTCNLDINNVKINGATLSSYYKICNGNAWMAYTDADNEPIRPAEGFLVKGDAGTVSFNAASRMDVVNGYVRLVLYEGDQKQDRTYLRITDGQALPKMRMNDVEAELYFREGSEDFAIAESREDVTEYLLCLKARHNGTYTIVADLLNTESNYLHLIDNITGEDIDLLATPTYTFEAKAIDDSSRFKLVVRANSSYK